MPARSAASTSIAATQTGASAAALDALAIAYPNQRRINVFGTWREETRFKLWGLRARAKHVFGYHTMIPLEEWDDGTIRFVGWLCWLCDRREP